MNETRILFWGIQRSGNHGIINWILEQYDGSKLFFNDQAFGEDLRINKELSLEISSNETRNLLLVSFENYNLTYLPDNYDRGCKVIDDSVVGKSLSTINILILRDPFNLWVSNRPPKDEPHDPKLWQIYAREFLGETGFLPNKICINFNEWFRDINYRKSISEKLEIPFSDAGLNKVSKYGGGSNFDKTRYDGQAQQMNVLGRWEQSKNFRKKRRLIKALRTDREMDRLTNRIYSDLYEQWNITTLSNFWFHWI